MDRATLEKHFKANDVDNNGSLSHDEFKKTMQQVKSGATDQEVETMFNKFDKDSNGKVTLEEFLHGMAH